MERYFVELVFELNYQTVCPESRVMAAPTAGNLTPMIVATSVEKVAIMPMTAIASARGVDAAADLDHAPVLDPVVAATALAVVAVAMRGSIVHLHTPNAEAGQAPQPALDPELRCVVHVHLCAGPKALFEDPERLSVETVVRVLVPGRGTVVCPDPVLGLVQSATKKTVVPGLPAQEEVQHQMLTDLSTKISPIFHLCLRAKMRFISPIILESILL